MADPVAQFAPWRPTVVPFEQAPPPPTPTELALDLIDRFREKIVTGAVTPQHLILCVVAPSGPDREETYALTTGMGNREMMGTLFAIATQLAMEPS